MDNQHRKITGYRELSQVEVDLMNRIKLKGVELQELVAEVHKHLEQQYVSALSDPQEFRGAGEVTRLDKAQARRWASIGCTDFQTGLMALTRAVAQPTTF